MPLTRLILVNLLLILGLLTLPPLAGHGTGSMFSRVWLMFGLLVLAGNFQIYLSRSKRPSAKEKPMAHHQTANQVVRSQEYR